MKLKWESISLAHQNLFLLKLVSAILISCLAFRFFVIRFGQFSPVQVSVNGNSDAQISPPSVILSDNEDLIPIDIEVEKCDLFTGKWIKDPLGPIYTNGSCGIVVDSHQNCITNGRPDSGFLYWKWKPNDCSLPRFDPHRFLQLMTNKSWALIGDSIARNHVESLLCMLSTVEKPVEVYHDENYRSKRWLFPSHNLSISNIWSPFLVEAAIFEDSNGVSSDAVQLHLDKLDKTWTDLFPSLDYAIISSGEWFLKTAVYHENANPIGCHGCAVRLRISKGHKDKHVNLYLSDGEIVHDVFQDVELKWRFVTDGGDKKGGGGGGGGIRGGRRSHVEDDGRSEYFELSFDKKHKDLILNSYVPYIEGKAKEIRDERRILMLHSLNSLRWESVILEHPSTFETMAMEDELKRDVIADLDRFIRRKEFYKRVGKAWKRGYLLYGPPGTGKSSLVAAMANYLKFDVYDLQLASVMRDSDLRRLLLATRNRSILVIEDIDCAVDLPNRLEQPAEGKNRGETQGPLTLSGLLNFIDGLWSSCGDERIIIFTTNHKDRLDPALLRPGRMDMHIYMGHCSFQGFKTLASNYLGLSSTTMPHRLYPEIERLIEGEVITPAQVAEELMKSEDADVALEDLVVVLKKMRLKSEESNPVMKRKESRMEMEEMKLRRDGEGSPRKNSKRIKKLVLFWT